MSAKLKNILLILIPTLVISIAYGSFFKFHLASDAYRIIDNTNEFMINLKLVEGRLIQVLYFVILSIFNISIDSIESYMLLSRINTLASIILLIICTIFIYKILEKYIQNITNLKKIILVISSLLITVNVSINEYILYFENVIIIFGLLLSILASYIYTKNIKFKYIIIGLLLLLSSFCYQAINQIFIILSILILVINNKDNNNKKYLLKELFKIGILYLLPLVINYIICYKLNCILPDLDPRLFNGIVNNIKDTLTVRNIAILGISLVIPSCIILANFKLFDNENIFKHFYKIFSLIIITVLSFIIFIFNNSCTLSPRVILNFYIIYPLLEIYIINLKNCNKFTTNIIVTSLMLVINIILVITLQNVNIDYTARNIEIVESFIQEIETYEKENNTKINNIAFYNDLGLNPYYWKMNINVCVSHSHPIYYSYHADIYSFNVLSGRKFNRTKNLELDKKTYTHFTSKNWDEPNTSEQITFIENTANICKF